MKYLLDTCVLSELIKSQPVMDSLIAATALRYTCTLVTRNKQDYTETGVPLLNPWSC